MRWHKRPRKDPRRWRPGFAFVPRGIGKHWVWLERYHYRRLDQSPYPQYEYATWETTT